MRLYYHTSSQWPAYKWRHALPDFCWGFSEGRRSWTFGVSVWRWFVSLMVVFDA